MNRVRKLRSWKHS